MYPQREARAKEVLDVVNDPNNIVVWFDECSIDINKASSQMAISKAGEPAFRKVLGRSAAYSVIIGIAKNKSFITHVVAGRVTG